LGHEIDKKRTGKRFDMIESIHKTREKPGKFIDVGFYNLKTIRD